MVFIPSVPQWSTKNWLFEEWFNSTLKSNTMKCKKLATIVSGQKNIARPFIRHKQGKHTCRNVTVLNHSSKKLLPCIVQVKDLSLQWTRKVSFQWNLWENPLSHIHMVQKKSYSWDLNKNLRLKKPTYAFTCYVDIIIQVF